MKELKLVDKVAENAPQPKETAVEDMAKVAQQALVEQVKSGEKSIAEASLDAVKAGAFAQASATNAEKYSKVGDKIISEDLQGDLTEKKAETRSKQNKDNEEFYATYRPILEFDFEFITGISKNSEVKSTKTKSYSKGAMITQIVFTIVPFMLFALLLCILKGVNAIVVMASTFTKSAKGVLIASVCAIALYIILAVIDNYLQSYLGITIFPK